MTTTLTPLVIQGPYPTLPPASHFFDEAWTTGDTAGTIIVVTSQASRYLLLWRNTDAGGAHNLVFNSVPDSLNRTGDITYSVGAAGGGHDFGMFFYSQTPGWVDGSSHITVTPADTSIQFMLLTF